MIVLMRRRSARRVLHTGTIYGGNEPYPPVNRAHTRTSRHRAFAGHPHDLIAVLAGHHRRWRPVEPAIKHLALPPPGAASPPFAPDASHHGYPAMAHDLPACRDAWPSAMPSRRHADPLGAAPRTRDGATESSTRATHRPFTPARLGLPACAWTRCSQIPNHLVSTKFCVSLGNS